MRLSIKSVNKCFLHHRKIRSLLHRAFPDNELIPFFLQIRAMSKSVRFLAYYDKDEFCGFSYSIENDQIAFVLYLAVNEQIRSKGYGTEMIALLKNIHKGKILTLNAEALDRQADNYAQRERRINFYLKNGFQSTDHMIIDHNDTYLILCTGRDFPLQDYLGILKKMSLGLYVPRVEHLNKMLDKKSV